MKRLITIVFLSAFTYASNAQSGDAIYTSSNDTAAANKSKAVEERLNKQEQELLALKKDNESLKKEVKQLKASAVRTGGNKKITISRVGSKQVVTE
ncbi:MAG: hypothetical protein JWQ40_3895 [Segetibacter sp.]|nr:hypothetical protein [Segetibacter sp.]